MQEILALIKRELSQIEPTVTLNLKQVTNLPIPAGGNYFHQVAVSGEQNTRYWIPWTEELGAWISGKGNHVEIVVSEKIENLDVGELTLGFTAVITGVCLNLQRQIAIHANAVAWEGLAVGFAGDSGMGKSTLSAYCASQGWSFITDDVLVVDQQGLVAPGNPRLKLYPDTGASLGLDIVQEIDYKIFYDPEQLGAQLLSSPIPIGIIYLLAQSDNQQIYSEPIAPSQAVFELLSHSYYAAQLIYHDHEILSSYINLVSEVTVRQLFYPRNIATLPKVYQFLSEEIKQL